MAASLQAFTTLLTWLQAQGVWWDPDAIDIVLNGDHAATASQVLQNAPALPSDATVASGRMGVVARRALNVDELIARIPKTAVLSVKNCGIANILEDEGLEGAIALALAVLFEQAQATTSPWYGYLQSLPDRVDLPMFWPSLEQAWLQGTDLMDQLATDMRQLTTSYQTLIQPVLDRYPAVFTPGAAFELDRFLAAMSLISSRAFEVDGYHGNAMVPLADIFNHRTGGEHVHIEGQGDVCLVCGELGNCDHQDPLDSDHRRSEASGSDDGASMQCSSDDAASEAGSFVSVNEDALDINVFRPVVALHEVFNTYGQHGSAHLLHHYGFVEPGSLCDSVTLALTLVDQHCLATDPVGWQSSLIRDVFTTFDLLDGHPPSDGWEPDCVQLRVHADGEVDARLLSLLTLVHHKPATRERLCRRPKWCRLYLKTLRRQFERMADTNQCPPPNPTAAKRSTKTSKRPALASTVEPVQEAQSLVQQHPRVVVHVLQSTLALLQARLARHAIATPPANPAELAPPAQRRCALAHTLRGNEHAMLAQAQQKYHGLLTQAQALVTASPQAP
ncbi:hypothetical protein H4R34_003155 [Dimargaris verticillata]|uniref:SET domain-containing protein n=1 Tax=Dimargaris verticillata TaxID=2761393 RepID=A0A9W8B2P8_9FUNG|nr:hypothetical protein H4R34_003155 [Dimargaris verticillata]